MVAIPFLRSLGFFWRSRRGGVLPVVMLTMPMMLALTALVVDIGILYVAKSKTEMAALDAADSALHKLPDTTAAEAMARQVVMTHISDAGYARDYSVTAVATASDITVTVDLQTSTFFAGIIGIATLETNSTVTRP